MRLYYKGDLTRTTFCTEDGFSLFRTTSNSGIRLKTTTLSRATPSSSEQPEQETFEPVAILDWKAFSADPAMVTFEGQEPIRMIELLRKAEMGDYAANRVFRASDGQEYHWQILLDRVKLTRHDGSRAPIATFHPRQFGIFGKKQEAYLKIEEAGMFMQDMIMVTFVYLQHRAEQQNQ